MFRATFKWTIDPVESLNNLSAGIKNKAMRIAINAGAAPVKAAVMASAPHGDGHLAKATRIKVKNYKNKSIWVAIVGATWGYKRLKKRKGKTVKKRDGKGATKRQEIRPALYQRFVDRGTKHFSGRNYLRQAFQQAKKQFETAVRRKLKEVIEQLMRKN